MFGLEETWTQHIANAYDDMYIQRISLQPSGITIKNLISNFTFAQLLLECVYSMLSAASSFPVTVLSD